MEVKQIKNELQNILSGESNNSLDALIQTVANYLRSGKRASPMAEEKHQSKAEETKRLIDFSLHNNLIYNDVYENNFVSSGAEQKVYIKDEHHVIKLNDAIYYASWEDYFHNLLLNNYFFPDTSYQLLGFYIKENCCFAVVQQAFVQVTSLTNLESVKEFLTNNGFINTKNNDYFHPVLGIILEDLHDENVLTPDGLLYFIDTVFYIKPEVFWR